MHEATLPQARARAGTRAAKDPGVSAMNDSSTPDPRLPDLRPLRRLVALLLVCAGAAPALAAAAPPALPTDPVLDRLIAESLAARPELKQAEAMVHAESSRVPQAGALPDPMLTLGIQNDGFQRIQVGEMETSYYQIMASQTFPWPGKRGAREDVARLGAKASESNVSRLRLSTEAEVRRAYLDLLVARDRLALLDRLEAIWQKSASIARTRYEAGEGAQSDVLRAQLELSRLKQRRFALRAEERTRVQLLDRLRGRPVEEPIETTAAVRDLPVPTLPALEAAVDDARARSPELAAARLSHQRAQRTMELARRDRFPDITVSAGIMPRGSLEPMWLASVGFTLPVWSGRKQSRGVQESSARASAEAAGTDSVDQVLRLRVAERRANLEALGDTIRIYREGLLVQSQATAESTLAQYRVGKVTFASVLEANAGYIADEESYLLAIADAQRIAIAALEVSLDASAGPSSAGGGAGMPGAGAAASGGGGMGGGAAASAPTAAASSSGSPSSM